MLHLTRNSQPVTRTMTLIIFDVDGTLVYSDKRDSQSFADTYEQAYGLPFPTIDWSKYPHVTDDTIFKTVIKNHFQREATEAEMATFKKAFTDSIRQQRVHTPDEFNIVPGAKQTIERLVEDVRYTVGIGTGGWKAPAVLKLNFVKIPTSPLFISGADGKETREQIIEDVLSQVKEQEITFNRVVYVGDAIWDVKTTRNMNLPLIGLRRKGDVDFLHQQGVKHVLPDFSDFDLFMEYIKQAVPPA